MWFAHSPGINEPKLTPASSACSQGGSPRTNLPPQNVGTACDSQLFIKTEVESANNTAAFVISSLKTSNLLPSQSRRRTGYERATKICHGITLIQLPCLTRKTTPTSTARRLIPLQHRAVISSPMLGSSSGRDHAILIDRIPDVAKHLVHDNPHKIKPGFKASER
ncbi:hypothetical protein AU210_003500 [Fusarium oxysporum f. sp. radicis-cucumerinum]|uniref:Uncharacterized protein n=1 Tax=Fusarium oxysporum f. sp. radicis-cucumerinum TaxID=327505 RepID=A0A2H3I599_FUSOX|nr:hypothetical protein AU210_003500 [Fusarium oxysporum f. sp. radicis-cucumerinum]